MSQASLNCLIIQRVSWSFPYRMFHIVDLRLRLHATAATCSNLRLDYDMFAK